LVIDDTISGNISGQFTTIIGTQQHVKAGRLRWLAISSPARSKVVPVLPAGAESGVPGFSVVGFYGVAMPAATPKPIVDRIAGKTEKSCSPPKLAGDSRLTDRSP